MGQGLCGPLILTAPQEHKWTEKGIFAASLCKCVRRQSACIFDEEQGSLVTFGCERQSLKCSEEEEPTSCHAESNPACLQTSNLPVIPEFM